MTEQITEVDPSSAELVPVGDGTIESAVEPATHGHAHPTPQQYVLIAVVLVVITAIEVATSYLEGDVNANLIIAALAVMAAVKFFLVVAWYMHLRFDSKIFRRFFLLGLIAAPILYTIVLLMFHVFDSNV
jgi:cytochrome c oxidase subunit IV